MGINMGTNSQTYANAQHTEKHTAQKVHDHTAHTHSAHTHTLRRHTITNTLHKKGQRNVGMSYWCIYLHEHTHTLGANWARVRLIRVSLEFWLYALVQRQAFTTACGHNLGPELREGCAILVRNRMRRQPFAGPCGHSMGQEMQQGCVILVQNQYAPPAMCWPLRPPYEA